MEMLKLWEVSWVGVRLQIISDADVFFMAHVLTVQRPADQPYDMIIPRASTDPAANSGSSSPSTHTEAGNTAQTQTSVGPTPWHLSLFAPHLSSLSLACLQMLSSFLHLSMSACCIHSNICWLTMNHFFVWIFFLTFFIHFLKALCLTPLLCSVLARPRELSSLCSPSLVLLLLLFLWKYRKSFWWNGSVLIFNYCCKNMLSFK